MMVAHRASAAEILAHFQASEMGADCRFLTKAERETCAPNLRAKAREVLFSARELRVESVTALPKLAAWLPAEMGVHFWFQTAVHEVGASGVITSRGKVGAGAVVLCPGDDFVTFYPEALAPYASHIAQPGCM